MLMGFGKGPHHKRKGETAEQFRNRIFNEKKKKAPEIKEEDMWDLAEKMFDSKHGIIPRPTGPKQTAAIQVKGLKEMRGPTAIIRTSESDVTLIKLTYDEKAQYRRGINLSKIIESRYKKSVGQKRRFYKRMLAVTTLIEAGAIPDKSGLILTQEELMKRPVRKDLLAYLKK